MLVLRMTWIRGGGQVMLLRLDTLQQNLVLLEGCPGENRSTPRDADWQRPAKAPVVLFSAL